MRQAIHIFKKDARHLRSPVAMLMSLLVARSALAPLYTPFYQGWGWNTTLDMLDLLLPLVWWFLIAAAIHNESLVGDRQFWITRPYSWRSVAAAKALFVAAFILLPVLISDAAILATAGFSPWRLAPGLLWFECKRLVILLPFAVLSAITRGFRQFLLGCLLIALAATAAIQIAQMHPQRSTPWLPLLFAVPLALLAWQYAQRRTAIVRSIAALFLLWLLLPFPPLVTPASRPASQEIGILFDAHRDRLDWRDASGIRGRVQMDIPIALTGRERDLLDASLTEITVQHDGQTWRPDAYVTSRRGADWLEISLTEPEMRSLSAAPVTLRADLELRVYEQQAALKLHRGDGWMPVPGIGYLRLMDDAGFPVVVRRMPLYDHEPKLVYTMPLKYSANFLTAKSSGTYPRDIGTLHLSPVITFVAGFGLSTGRQPTSQTTLLVGDEVTVKVERPIALVNRTLTIEGVRLEDWVVGQ